MVGTFDESGLGDVPVPADEQVGSMVSYLQGHGYKVELCDKCDGWGRITNNDPFSREVTEDVCTDCKGTGRKLANRKVKLVPFVIPDLDKKRASEWTPPYPGKAKDCEQI